MEPDLIETISEGVATLNRPDRLNARKAAEDARLPMTSDISETRAGARGDEILSLVEVREHLGRVYNDLIAIGDKLDRHLQDHEVFQERELHTLLHRLRMVICDTVQAMHSTRERAGWR